MNSNLMKPTSRLRPCVSVVPPSRGEAPPPPPPPTAEHQLRTWMHDGLHDLGRAGRVLALGCDEVFLATHLADYAAEVTVLDTSAGQLGHLARRYPEINFMRHHPAQPLPFAAGTFAAIWCGEILDRVFNPAAVLSEIFRVLAPDGRLMVTVPDHGAMRRGPGATSSGEAPVTSERPCLRLFTRDGLVRLVRQAGFGHIHTAGGRASQRSAGAPRRLLLRATKEAAASAGIVLERRSGLALASRLRAA